MSHFTASQNCHGQLKAEYRHFHAAVCWVFFIDKEDVDGSVRELF